MNPLDEDTGYDLLIVTRLAHQMDALLPALQRSAANCSGPLLLVMSRRPAQRFAVSQH